MISLAAAGRQLSLEQHELLTSIATVAHGPEHIHDLAFVHLILVELEVTHADTPVGWAIVSAHKALLKMAQSEGLIGDAVRG